MRCCVVAYFAIHIHIGRQPSPSYFRSGDQTLQLNSLQISLASMINIFLFLSLFRWMFMRHQSIEYHVIEEVTVCRLDDGHVINTKCFSWESHEPIIFPCVSSISSSGYHFIMIPERWYDVETQLIYFHLIFHFFISCFFHFLIEWTLIFGLYSLENLKTEIIWSNWIISMCKIFSIRFPTLRFCSFYFVFFFSFSFVLCSFVLSVSFIRFRCHLVWVVGGWTGAFIGMCDVYHSFSRTKFNFGNDVDTKACVCVCLCMLKRLNGDDERMYRMINKYSRTLVPL